MHLLCTNENISWDIATLIVGSLAFLGVIFEIIMSFKRDKYERESQIITANRVLWMSELREKVSNCSKQIFNFCKSKSHLNNAEDFKWNKNQIFLLLNYHDDKDNDIRKYLTIIEKNIAELLSAYETDQSDKVSEIKEKLSKLDDFLIDFVSIYLKCEWTRVKLCGKKSEDADYDFNKTFDEYYSKVKEKMDPLKQEIDTWEN